MLKKVDAIKDLRMMTSAGVSDCKKALDEAKGDKDKALSILRKRGLDIAKKKSGRIAAEGRVEAYVHIGSKLGVLVQVNCESDFVAKNEEFSRFIKDLALQIAAANPFYIDFESVPADEKEKIKNQEKEDFCKQYCLLDQPFVKDASKTVGDYLVSIIAKVGENIVIKRFSRFSLTE